ncbi:MAG: hypothetical protein JWQ43_3978 [Glaciihabitans sp.]|nr:hypothetical protein [Glaciihabitans sp.]
MTGSTQEPRTEHVVLRGIDFAFSDQGRGPVVLSAHGLSSSRANNRLMGLSDFSEVAQARRRLISYDARGHGESSGSNAEEDYTWAALAGDMLTLADHFSPDTPVSAIGSSMGTGTLLHAATRRPERFDRLILTAPPTAWETRAGQAENYRKMADLIETSSPETLADMMGQAPVPPVFREVLNFPPAPDMRDGLMPTIFRGAALADLPSLDTLSTLTQPTLIIAWAGDPGHPVSTAEMLHGALSNSELHVSETPVDLATWGERAARFLSR